MKITDLLFEDREGKDTVVQMFKDFFPLAMEILEIKHLPKMNFQAEINAGDQPSFGMYDSGEKILHVALKNRHPNDILRTVAHELVHYKQDNDGILNLQSGDTGSPEENQANELAGVIMRHFNKRYPRYLGSKPL